ncbi:unnamed protein product, partial [marine sediment metagenome]
MPRFTQKSSADIIFVSVQELHAQRKTAEALKAISALIVGRPNEGQYYALRGSIYNEVRKDVSLRTTLNFSPSEAAQRMRDDYNRAEHLNYKLSADDLGNLAFGEYHEFKWQAAVGFFDRMLMRTDELKQEEVNSFLKYRKKANTNSTLSRKVEGEDSSDPMVHIARLFQAEWSWQEIEAELMHKGALPLFLEAASIGNLQLMQYMMQEKGEDEAKVTDSNGNTALHLAAKKGHDTLVEFLGRYLSYDTLNNKMES